MIKVGDVVVLPGKNKGEVVAVSQGKGVAMVKGPMGEILRYKLDELEPEGQKSKEEEGQKRTAKCSRCGKILTSKESVERGIGPVCMTKE